MPVIKQDPKIKDGANVIVLTSIDLLPGDTPDNTIIVVPKSENIVYSKYRYNEVELPALPEWDKTQYPFAVIYIYPDTYDLVIGTGPHYYLDDDGAYWFGPRMDLKYSVAKENGEQWVKDDSNYENEVYYASVDTDSVLWTNIDILDQENNVVFEASDPVPVENTDDKPVNADLYVKKNGKVYKTTSGGEAYGTSGIAVLTAGSWRDGYYTLTVADLGNQDAIFFTPSTRDDKTALEDADVFISSTGQTVIFEAAVTPTTNIALFYFITRGA